MYFPIFFKYSFLCLYGMQLFNADPKGQLISKQDCRAITSPKKQMWDFCPGSLQKSYVFFLSCILFGVFFSLPKTAQNFIDYFIQWSVVLYLEWRINVLKGKQIKILLMNDGESKSDKIILSESIFYDKNQLNFKINFFFW